MSEGRSSDEAEEDWREQSRHRNQGRREQSRSEWRGSAAKNREEKPNRKSATLHVELSLHCTAGAHQRRIEHALHEQAKLEPKQDREGKSVRDAEDVLEDAADETEAEAAASSLALLPRRVTRSAAPRSTAAGRAAPFCACTARSLLSETSGASECHSRGE